MKRLKKLEEGDTRRCPECGRVGIQIYKVHGEEYIGLPRNSHRLAYEVVNGTRFCANCNVDIHDKMGDK